MLFVSDINDNAPVFVGLPYRTTVRENAPVGSSVYTVSATDPDTGLGSRPVFSIKANIPANQADYEATFTMNATFGYITLRKKLDYETRSFYHFRVSVKSLYIRSVSEDAPVVRFTER
ncbi:protocadherin gamma-A3 [Aplysia californica]|uniref:Protocadherin gamma-A3 n=1 Tax=Aplysia californica TaxID=6500 RepID=A0ABM1VQ19_APLCA|nr:protocadherin gamma-A3 [Aplysia californica]